MNKYKPNHIFDVCYQVFNMDLPWGNEKTVQFITNVGLITSNGPHGHDITSVEWTHQVSYSPGLIAICINESHAACDNINKTKEFGVSICAIDQSRLSSVAGSMSGKDYDKIAALKELGFEFYNADKIKTVMVKGAALNLECKVIKKIGLGDHIMFVGEIISAATSEKEPLAYHKGRYWKMETQLEKPSEKEREKIRQILEKHRRKK